MPLTLHVSTHTTRPPDIGARKWSDFSKAGMTAVADLWHEQFIAPHFQTAAKYRYGYQARKDKTRARKIRAARVGKALKGGQVDLVWTGALEQQMLRRGILRVYPTRFVLRKPAGSYITDRPRGGRPNMVREITTVHPHERSRMGVTFANAAANLMNTYRATRTTKS